MSAPPPTMPPAPPLPRAKKTPGVTAMPATADHAARANSVGDPCPAWCTTGHGPDVTDIHETAEAAISLDGPRRYGYLMTQGLRFHAGDMPRVAVYARHRDMHAPDVIVQSEQYIPAADALKLAGLVDVLAHATPEQHRELAAAIRQAASQITGATDG